MVPDAHGANTANRNAATVTVAGGCVIRIWINRKLDITVLNKMKSYYPVEGFRWCSKAVSMRQDMHDIGQVLSFQGNGAGGTGILVIGHEQAILQETAGIQDQGRGVRHDFQGPARTGITQNTCLF